jgi:hypothetical protein
MGEASFACVERKYRARKQLDKGATPGHSRMYFSSAGNIPGTKIHISVAIYYISQYNLDIANGAATLIADRDLIPCQYLCGRGVSA